ncbi:MAG TPA: nucleotidyltransferase family protein, partial [Candidatus Eisenbacteria bacterium]|nr:nucleotidyltransferase family protein [Candidatus Eisenbacteria bacterium]
LPLAQRFYGDIGQRRIADLDLLVRPREVPEAERLLGKAGFRRTSRLLFGGTLASRFTPCLEYKKENLGLDLHWQLRSHPSFRVDYDRLWRTSETAAVGDRAFGVPSAEYELLTQILSIFTDVQLGTILLKSFVDVHKILEAVEESLDWDRFFLDRREEGLLRISVNVLDLALDALDARDRFPRLGSRLAGHASCVRWTRREKKMRLLERSKAALRNKSWAFPLYETTPFRTFSWWALSLPFRVAASPTGRQKWKQRVER